MSGQADRDGGAAERGTGDIAALVPLAVGAAAIWFVTDAQSYLLLSLTLFWGGAVLIFFAGTRRGAALAGAGSLVSVLWLFAAGFAGLIGTVWAYPMLAAFAEMAGFASLLVLGSAWGGRTSGRSRLGVAALAILALAAVAAFIQVSPLV